MIYAEFSYQGHYSDYHDAIVQCLEAEFKELQHGHQGDSWIWVFDGEDKVAIDTFYSMQHEIKSESDNISHIHRVIDTLKRTFEIRVFNEPELEPHE